MQLSSTITYLPLDFFHRFQVQKNTNNWDFSVNLGYGINRTLFQKRLFPQIGLYVGYFVLSKNKTHLSTGISYQMFTLKLVDSHTFWQEPALAYHFQYGEKWRLIQEATFGYRFENYRSQFSQNRTNVGSLSYSFSIGLAYAW